jgi:hypothetical protein
VERRQNAIRCGGMQMEVHAPGVASWRRSTCGHER